MIAVSPYIIKQDFIKPVYQPYGGCDKFFHCTDPEVIASGPAETGKTLAACWKIHLLACKYPEMQGSIVRKTQKSVYGSVLQTYERILKSTKAPVVPYGGETPQKYIYANGSEIWVGGLDNPEKVLSSERDIIYFNQAEEGTLNDWEMLTTRTTGRSSVIRFTQLIGDCNPAGTLHYIRKRVAAGVLTLIPTVHRDNPTLYDPKTGEITQKGIQVMARLSNLTGVRRKRLFEGIWATAEGAVYDTFDPAIHVRERAPEEMKSWYLAQDEGYTHPAVILLVGMDSDGRLHVFREFYKTRVLQKDVVAVDLEWSREHTLDLVAVDEAAAGLIADLRDVDLPARGYKGRVLDGITSIQARLKVQADGKPRLTVDPGCTNTINEFESYIWKPEKDEPVKENDHAMDAIRYLDNALGDNWFMS